MLTSVGRLFIASIDKRYHTNALFDLENTCRNYTCGIQMQLVIGTNPKESKELSKTQAEVIILLISIEFLN